MNKSALLGSVAVLAAVIGSAAFASEASTPSINPASLSSYNTGNDRSQLALAPNYSEELGWSLKGSAGSYLSDDLAIGLIVEYGENKREYLANAGVQLSDAYSFIGTVGMLEEHNEYVDGEGREIVQQMEYGLSLKSASEAGLISGHELNGYLADASTNSDSVEAGKVYGVQFLTGLNLSDTTHIKIGGGHEWLRWDGGEGDDDSFTFSAEGSQSLSDRLSLNARSKLGVSESIYGAGLAYNLSDTSFNSIGVDYTSINGRNGIEDDQRVELSWSIGFGAGPTSSFAAADLTDKIGTIRAAADVVMVSPANNLLGDVMKRPAFLPERVLGRSVKGRSSALCPVNTFVFDPTATIIGSMFVVEQDSIYFQDGTTATFSIYVNGILVANEPTTPGDGYSAIYLASNIWNVTDQVTVIGDGKCWTGTPYEFR